MSVFAEYLFDTGNPAVIFGVGIGKIVKIGSTVLNFFIEPQFIIHDEGPGQPEFKIYAGLNMQFY